MSRKARGQNRTLADSASPKRKDAKEEADEQTHYTLEDVQKLEEELALLQEEKTRDEDVMRAKIKEQEVEIEDLGVQYRSLKKKLTTSAMEISQKHHQAEALKRKLPPLPRAARPVRPPRDFVLSRSLQRKKATTPEFIDQEQEQRFATTQNRSLPALGQRAQMIETFVDHGGNAQPTESHTASLPHSPDRPLDGTGAVLPQQKGAKMRNFQTIPAGENAVSSLVSFN